MTYNAPVLPAHVASEANIRLGRLEAETGITILLAVESGSRAWGFPSPDSDNDVRFLFVRPVSKYLGLSYPDDTVNPKIDGLWDLSGWDIRKALQLLVKGNATPGEWLQSPLIYREHGPFAPKMRDLIKRHSNPDASAKHYYGLTNTCYKRDIQNAKSQMVGDDPKTYQAMQSDGRVDLTKTMIVEVNQKKYLYAIRGAISIAWIERYDEIPPMTLPALMAYDIIPDEIRPIIQGILDRKATMGEFGNGPRITVLDNWIESKLAWVKNRGLDKLDFSKEFEDEANQLLLNALGIG